MRTNRNIIVKVFHAPSSTLREVLFIILNVIKILLLVRIVPLRFYFNNYFSDTESHIPDKQLLYKNLCLYKRVLRALPFKLTCLVESMVLYNFLKRHGILNPIHIGIRIEGKLTAHAWNAHQFVSDFKSIR